MAFKDYLDRKHEDIKQPPLLPVGTYLAKVSKQPESDDINDDLEKLTFIFQVINAVDIPDEAALEEYGNVAGAFIRHEFLFNKSPEEEAGNERTVNNLKGFLERLDAFEPGMSLGEALANSVGTSCLVEVRHDQDKRDPEKFYLRVARTYAE